ncbi:MAG: hypothetical protein IJV98_02235 [Clostridia bacterium]|nr:hypothetical protein [Clostridia bacterium]
MKMKKIISLFLALVMSAVLFTACGEESEIPDGMQLVENEFVSYKFYVPDDWLVDTTKDGFLCAKASDNSNVSVQTMTYSGNYTSLSEYFRTDYFKKLETTFKSVTLLEEESSEENQTVGTAKNPAVKYVYLVESDGATYKIMQYFSYNAGYLYAITYTGKVKDTAVNGETVEVTYFADHLEEVSSIVANFVF